MEEPVASNDVIVNVGSLDALHLDTWRWRAILGSTVARFGCAALLLVAAALKAYQIFTDPALGVVHGLRWLQAVLVEYELLVALWLLSGIGLPWGRRVALLTFIGFGCYAFFLGISGEASCGCFGKAHISPWWTFGIDAASAFLLFAWKPRRVRDDLEAGSGYVHLTARVFLVVAAAFAVIGIPALSIAVWRAESDSSIESALANSRFVLLEPEKWIDKPFPLTDYIDIAERERLSRGSWIVVFYRHDCPKCQQSLPRYEQLSEQLRCANEGTNIALIEIPPYGPAMLSVNQLCRIGRLSDSKEWLITTPSEVRVTDGLVTAAASTELLESTGPDDQPSR